MFTKGRKVVGLGLIFVGLSAIAADAQVLTVSAKPLDGWITDARALGTKILPEQFLQPLKDLLEKLADPATLKGFDRTRPIGAFGDFQPGGVPFLAICLPVTDSSSFLNSVKSFGLIVEPGPGDANGVSHVVTFPNGNKSQLFAYPLGRWLFLTMQPTDLPAIKNFRPEILASIQPSNSELTVSVRLDRIPGGAKDEFLKAFHANMAATKDRDPGEEEAAYLGRTLTQDVLSIALERLVKEGREIALDIVLSPKAGPLSADLRIEPMPGSGLARSFRDFGTKRSRFQGLGSKTVMETRGIFGIPEVAKLPLSRLVDLVQKDEEGKAPNELERRRISSFSEIFRPILTGENFDFSVALQGPYSSSKPNQPGGTYVVAMGLKLKDGQALDRALREKLKKGDITLDVAKSADGKIAIHRLAGNSESAPDSKMFGRAVPHVAIVDDAVLIVFGEKSLRGLQEVLGQIGKPTQAQGAPIMAAVSFSKVLPFSAVARERELGAKTAKEVFVGSDANNDRLYAAFFVEGETLHLKVSGDVLLLKFFMNLGLAIQSK